MSEDKLVKVLLHNGGEDVETPWAEDLGPAPGGGRRVRLDNVPFLHAKPTFGDVIVVRESQDYEGQLAWDRGSVPWDQIGSRIELDGGRYAMIVDYRANDVDRFGQLSEWLATGDIVPEGCFGPRDGKPGRLYLAVPRARGVVEVMAALGENDLGFGFTLVHPEADRAAKPRAPTVKGVVPAEAVKKPAAPKPVRAATAKPIAARPARAATAKPTVAKPARAATAKGGAKSKPTPKTKAKAIAARATSAVKDKAAKAKSAMQNMAARAKSAAKSMTAKKAPPKRAKTSGSSKKRR